MPDAAGLTVRDRLRVFAPAAALIRISEGLVAANPISTQTVFATFRDASELLWRLPAGGHTVVAGRLAGAFRHIGRAEAADEIMVAMKAAVSTCAKAIRSTLVRRRRQCC
jgi:hypothetical protein